jgi:hypothetical protein
MIDNNIFIPRHKKIATCNHEFINNKKINLYELAILHESAKENIKKKKKKNGQGREEEKERDGNRKNHVRFMYSEGRLDVINVV